MQHSNSERTYTDFKADKKRKFPELFSSSDDSDNEPCPSQAPSNSKSDPPSKYEPPSTMPYKSKSSQYGACQQWTRYCKWWEDLKQSGAVFIGVLLDPNIFDNFSEHDMHMRMEELMFKVSHLQRAHLLSLYVKDLSPIKDGLTHYDGGTIKGYIDSIVRRLRVEECTNRQFSSYYGNWSWLGNTEYTFLSETLQRKLVKEDKDFRGQKKKNSKTSDSITPASFKKIMLRTKTRDDYRAKNDMHNYIKTNASLCVHIHTYFCGCRAQKEISEIIVQDFTDMSKNCIKFEQSSDFKTRKLGSNFNFIDREASFILGEEYCEPFRIFLYKRPPNAIDRFFLYDTPSARFEQTIWLSAAKPIGPRPLSLAVGNEIASMISEGIVADGNYSNTSLRKGLSDRLGFAHVPPVLIDLAVGHFNSKSDQSSSAFTSMPNLPTYLSMWKQSLTRKKIALLLFAPNLSWKDIENEDHFHEAYSIFFPNDNLSASNHFYASDESLQFHGTSTACKNDISLPLEPISACENDASLFDDSVSDDFFLAFLTPPELKEKLQNPTHTQPHPQNYAQTNTAMSFSANVAPVLHISGGTVNITFASAPTNMPL